MFGKKFCQGKNFVGKIFYQKKKILLEKNSQIRDKTFRKVMKFTKIWPIK